nr:MAG TPA: hypothetical protein [Caudoviricetes sp.]
MCNKYQKNKIFLLDFSPYTVQIRIIKAENAEDFYHLQETFP